MTATKILRFIAKGDRVEIALRDEPDAGARTGFVTRTHVHQVYVTNADDQHADEPVFGQWVSRDSFDGLDPTSVFVASLV